MSFIVRMGSPADAPVIALIHQVSWRQAYRGVLPDGYLRGLRWASLAERWRQVMSGAACPHAVRDRVWVIERAGEVVGFTQSGASSARDLEPGFAGEVYMLYVHPAHQRLGLGRTLVEAALDELEARGFLWAVIGVLEANAPARTFYERLGFERDGARWIDDLGGGRHVVIRYARALSSLLPPFDGA